MKVRFAPSPTGSLHVGGARTALFNYLMARRHQGRFVLRIEDTDAQRNIPEATWSMLEDLRWLGLDWDEGPLSMTETRGKLGPYFQSERRALYAQWAQWLIDRDLAYYCFLNDEELQDLKEQQIAEGGVHHVHSPYRDLSKEEALRLLEHRTATIRVKVPHGRSYQFEDGVRGSIDLPAEMVSDFVIMRSCGSPVYNYSCVVDDHLMGITDVLRGEEHLSNTLKQLILYEIFGWSPPRFAHLSVIVGEDRKKLSKREASVSVREFRDQGYLPEALVNFIALLGWSHPEGQELMSLETMARDFDLGRVHASSAYFDRAKLKWFNAHYLKRKSTDEIYDLLKERAYIRLEEVPLGIFERFWELYRSDCETLSDVEERFRKLYDVMWPESWSAPVPLEMARSLWAAWATWLAEHSDEWCAFEAVNQAIQDLGLAMGLKGKQLFMPLRWAVLGSAQGADVASVAALLPRGQLLQRVHYCLKTYLSDT